MSMISLQLKEISASVIFFVSNLTFSIFQWFAELLYVLIHLILFVLRYQVLNLCTTQTQFINTGKSARI